jgi:hypothetical protein
MYVRVVRLAASTGDRRRNSEVCRFQQVQQIEAGWLADLWLLRFHLNLKAAATSRGLSVPQT